jgi:predicted nucleotidyltransferase component of viral defense system
MKNIAASIRAKLLNYARNDQVPFQRVLTLYMQEGLLHRIVASGYGKDIILKGGLLFYQLQGIIARPTKDIDLLGPDNNRSNSILGEISSEACKIEIEDGLRFDPETIQTGPIKGQTDHGGIRGYITGYLGSARTQLQLDMGFGDVITGGPINRPYRTILDNRSFSIQTYSDETVAAEKLEAFISLGTVNSRFKDLYDLYELLIISNLPQNSIVEAAVNTFRNRNSALPESPESLADNYWNSKDFETHWKRYLKRIEAKSPDINILQTSLLEPLRTIYKTVRSLLDAK